MDLSFLVSEAFWMETIIAAVIAALATLATALIIAFVAVRPDLKNLNRDHTDLHKEHESLLENIKQLDNTTTFLRDAQLKEDIRREQLKAHQLDTQKILDMLTTHQKFVEKLTQENAQLKKELSALQKENFLLKQNLLTNCFSPEQENELEP